MIISAKSSPGELKNADTGQVIRWARWANLQTGEYEAFRCDPRYARARGIPLRSLLYRGRCRLLFTPTKLLDPKPAGRVAPSTPMDEIRREILKGGEIRTRPILLIPGQKPPECDEPLCHRPAEYSVAVERLVEPERGADGKLYERAVTVATSVWCPWHFRPPRQISERGVEIELDNIKTRPQ